VLFPEEVMMGGGRFLPGKAVVLGVPAPSRFLRVKLMAMNYIKILNQHLESTNRSHTCAT
jgi:hypothetical protein